MKRLFTCFLLSTNFFTLYAQDFYISFQPKAGADPIDTVWVTNQSTDQKVRLSGSESLHLIKPTAINSLRSGKSDAYLWPNPCSGVVSLDFQTDITETVTAGLFNISGQLLDMVKVHLTPGWHRFSARFPVAGIYYLSLDKTEGAVSLKAVSTGSQQQDSRIAYEGEVPATMNGTAMRLKNGTTEKTMSYDFGELLFYCAYSGKNSVILTDAPSATKVYTLEFVPCIDSENQTYPIVKVGPQNNQIPGWFCHSECFGQFFLVGSVYRSLLLV
jgi:hypothetical protein